MPWKELQVLDQRTEFVLKSLSRDVVFNELCREYGISTKTGYKWRERLIQEGLGGLHDRSRRPHNSPKGLNENIVCEIIKLKTAHPHWGPYKIRQLYLRKYGEAPSDSSFKRVLDKAGLVTQKKRRKVDSAQQRITTDLVIEKPNDVWTVDFKGWWKALGGGRCEPLTVRDHYSKYMLSVKAMESTRTEHVKAEFESLFCRYGLPKVILSDNGPPFAVSHALLGLSSLAIWWIAQGIRLHRIRPASPQENGSHERMHRDIKREVQGRINGNIQHHQAAFDIWKKEYNEVRPHETLGMKVPAEMYCKSDRQWSGSLD
ncbi:IS481 family transposase [Chitinispirillales bacterium ANBcel5]|uniref:integrase core domain-containing protein n=1 Tax=Cellulosispirillum alkaliphilum TaxID=3039283 RepID=UPI002A583A78|nr:IS481 family transposase [Chitinispirillales bacterium ANBcel5]